MNPYTKLHLYELATDALNGVAMGVLRAGQIIDDQIARVEELIDRRAIRVEDELSLIKVKALAQDAIRCNWRKV